MPTIYHQPRILFRKPLSRLRKFTPPVPTLTVTERIELLNAKRAKELEAAREEWSRERARYCRRLKEDVYRTLRKCIKDFGLHDSEYSVIEDTIDETISKLKGEQGSDGLPIGTVTFIVEELDLTLKCVILGNFGYREDYSLTANVTQNGRYLEDITNIRFDEKPPVVCEPREKRTLWLRGKGQKLH